ncbi:hypothetical protein ELE36_06460 [Pseudolysobacter antarcticus]|uniref:Uncharacterized protein n=1 Tax=Pseudolysobacter antarcticus TaxID=2511995 RepID=A0A411HHS0_9GAMM|nr:hypothetical protein [Pseudolysobacter antarcticus]QBB70031.1 hypothetical protein ELE36_06460 [Pseudolysobacter antarcticus]
MFIHSPRCMRWQLFASVLFFALPLLASAAPCTPTATPWLTLRITAGAMSAAADRTTIVRVHNDGCTELHRPKFLRASGDYRLSLPATEIAALHMQVSSDVLRGFDEHQVRATIDAAQPAQGASQAALKPQFAGQPQRLAVMDGDRYELSWNDAGISRSASWVGLSDDAQAYPDIAALQIFDRVSASLRSLVTRDDATKVAAAAP